MTAKRVFDIGVGMAGLVIASPFLVIVGVLIKLTSRGPVLHRAVRVGREGAPFTLLKFRTMKPRSSGPGITVAGDSRITAVGKWLRRFKIDEVPQLVNVVRGEMSLVGPRPEDPRYVADYTDEQRLVLSVRPGITSPASLEYRHEEQLIARRTGDLETVYRDEILPVKLAIDLRYVRSASVWTDVKIIVRTALGVFQRDAG